MNVDTRLAEKRHDRYKQLFVGFNNRLAENRKRLEEEEMRSTAHVPTEKIRAKLHDTEVRMRQYEEGQKDGWDEITSVIEGMIDEVESLFKDEDSEKDKKDRKE